MTKCIRTNSNNTDFRKLVVELDAYLKVADGDAHPFFDQFNKIDKIKYVVVAYEDATPVGCGAIKEYSKDIMEIKRMYVPAHKRNCGIASMVLSELEKWAKETGSKKCILETGKNQPEALVLYPKRGYMRIPNYGQYEKSALSVCFEKTLL